MWLEIVTREEGDVDPSRKTLDDIHLGDALFFRTCWAGQHWTSNPAAPKNDRLRYLNAGKEEFGPGSPGLDAHAVQRTLNGVPH